jgi:hypothetical protein
MQPQTFLTWSTIKVSIATLYIEIVIHKCWFSMLHHSNFVPWWCWWSLIIRNCKLAIQSLGQLFHISWKNYFYMQIKGGLTHSTQCYTLSCEKVSSHELPRGIKMGCPSWGRLLVWVGINLFGITSPLWWVQCMLCWREFIRNTTGAYLHCKYVQYTTSACFMLCYCYYKYWGIKTWCTCSRLHAKLLLYSFSVS